MAHLNSSPSMIRSDLDISNLVSVFQQKGRVQIRNLLTDEAAQSLRATLKTLGWRLVLNERGRHIDIHPLQLSQISPAKLREIKATAKARAAYDFQYLYENYPIFDLMESGNDVPPLISALYNELNSQRFRALLEKLTGETTDFCDIQATRYRAGHFLTTHDDGVTGKNRKLAFVLNLSKRWRQSWGGCLIFSNDTPTIETGKDHSDIFVPVFNSLSLFKVPQPHRVSEVRTAAKSSRLSLTGWFRTHPAS